MISGCGKRNISHSQFQKILFIATVVGPSPIGFDSAFGKANRLPQRPNNNGRFFLSQDILRKTFKKKSCIFVDIPLRASRITLGCDALVLLVQGKFLRVISRERCLCNCCKTCFLTLQLKARNKVMFISFSKDLCITSMSSPKSLLDRVQIILVMDNLQDWQSVIFG